MNFSKLNILVLGDIFLDEYQFGECTRISQEAPVPIVKIDHTKTRLMLGGAGNVAANIRSLGGKCTLIGRIGEGLSSHSPLTLFERLGINFLGIHQGQTTLKTRIIARHQHVVRVDEEEFQNCDGKLEDYALDRCAEILSTVDAVVFSDYAKGFFNRLFTRRIIGQVKINNKLMVADTKPSNVGFFLDADWFTPNLEEYHAMRDIPSDKILVTKGSEGMECHNVNNSFTVPAIRREVVDVAGAGDTVVAAFTLALAAKMTIKEAVEFANLAAGVVVGKQGTSTVTVAEIESLENEIHGIRLENSP